MYHLWPKLHVGPFVLQVFKRTHKPSIENPGDSGLLDCSGHRPCDHCQRTFARWYCFEEQRALCSQCDTSLHPPHNRTLHKHRRVSVQAYISGSTVPFRTVLLIHLWEAYRLVGPATVVGICQIFLCTDTICDGRTPETCAKYLTTDTSIVCGSAGYTVMLAFGISGVVFWSSLVPLAATIPVLKNHLRLHQVSSVGLCVAAVWGPRPGGPLAQPERQLIQQGFVGQVAN